jgi:hypothetical protein
MKVIISNYLQFTSNLIKINIRNGKFITKSNAYSVDPLSFHKELVIGIDVEY